LTWIYRTFNSITANSNDRFFRNELKSLLGVKPVKLVLYKRAFRHKSVAKLEDAKLISNERLEFLGDAVLELIVREYLYTRYPLLEEGKLSELTSRIVSRDFLNQMGYLTDINRFIEINPNDSALLKQPHSIHGNTIEALLGAVYLDRGFVHTRRTFVNMLNNMPFDIDSLLNEPVNYKSKLLEWAQKEDQDVCFKVIEENMDKKHIRYTVALSLNGKVLGEGSASKKKKAENLAAFNALKQVYPDNNWPEPL
jgi:ribonuclease III